MNNNNNSRGDDDQNDSHSSHSPQDKGQSSISGSTPGLTSDDNVLDNAHEAGLYGQADEEHPVELNIAEEIEKAEKVHQDKS